MYVCVPHANMGAWALHCASGSVRVRALAPVLGRALLGAPGVAGPSSPVALGSGPGLPTDMVPLPFPPSSNPRAVRRDVSFPLSLSLSLSPALAGVGVWGPV